MCYLLYLGSEQELPLLPGPDWELIKADFPARAPRLIIEPVAEREAAVANHFNEKYVVYAGSFMGCGCGFNHCVPNDEQYNEQDDDEETMMSLFSREALCSYITSNKVSSIYGCWDGDQSNQAEGEIDVTTDILLDRSFEFPEKIKVRILTP